MRRRLILPAVLAGLSAHLSAECSDAGICRLATADRATASPTTIDAGIRAGLAAGKAEEGITYRTLTPSLGWRPIESLRLSAELPLISLQGRRGDATGIGDAIVAADQRLVRGAWGSLAIQAGARLSTGDDNANPGLPQGYQPGLGGTDLLAGLAWRLDPLQLSVGYQRAAGRNDLEGVHLHRGDDLSLGVAFNQPVGDLRLGAALIAIRRLDESIVDGPGGSRIAVPDSDGTQANLRLGLGWPIAKAWQVDLAAAVPMLSRDQDADGLARRYGIELGVSAGF